MIDKREEAIQTEIKDFKRQLKELGKAGIEKGNQLKNLNNRRDQI